MKDLIMSLACELSDVAGNLDAVSQYEYSDADLEEAFSLALDRIALIRDVYEAKAYEL